MNMSDQKAGFGRGGSRWMRFDSMFFKHGISEGRGSRRHLEWSTLWDSDTESEFRLTFDNLKSGVLQTFVVV